MRMAGLSSAAPREACGLIPDQKEPWMRMRWKTNTVPVCGTAGPGVGASEGFGAVCREGDSTRASPVVCNGTNETKMKQF